MDAAAYEAMTTKELGETIACQREQWFALEKAMEEARYVYCTRLQVEAEAIVAPLDNDRRDALHRALTHSRVLSIPTGEG